MANREAPEASQTELEIELESSSQLLRDVADGVRNAREMVGREVSQLDSPELFARLKGKLDGIGERAAGVVRAADATRNLVEDLLAEWTAARRWGDEALAELALELRAMMSHDPIKAAERWLNELFDALDAQAWDAVLKIAGADLPWPERLRAGAERIARDLGDWRDGDAVCGLELMTAVGEGSEIERWERVLVPSVRSRAHRLAAWVRVRQLNDGASTRALEHMNEAVALYPFGGRMQAERAAYFLFIGDLDMALTDAQQAIERAGEDTHGYLELGIWAELTGEFASADDFFERALNRTPTFQIERLLTRATMIDPTGRLLATAAKILHGRGSDASALQLADHALFAQIRGSEPHPKAAVHALRSSLLEKLAPRSAQQAAAAALKSGELYMWNGELDDALEQSQRAKELDRSLAQAGWLRADALAAQSLPRGAVLPDEEILARARQAWDEQLKERKSDNGGPPAGATSWAYLTRAVLADLATQLPGGDREAGLWTAIANVERALAHDDSDAQRWAFAAQYLRYAGLEELALEAVNRGGSLKADDRRVLVERLVLLAARGPVNKADEIADQLERMYGLDPQVTALRTQIVMRNRGWKEAIVLLELPLSEGNDPLWYLDMRALCKAGLADPKGARADYREMLMRNADGRAPAVNGVDKCRLAGAAAMVGARRKARRWIDSACADHTTTEWECCKALVWLSLADDDPRSASQALERAVLAAASTAQIDSLVLELSLRGRVLSRGGFARPGRLERAAAKRARATQIKQEPASAAAELARRLQQLDAPAAGDKHQLGQTALLAVSARRHMFNRDWQTAASFYERLAGRFDPEAELCLARAMRYESEAAAERGDVKQVAAVQARLEERGLGTPVDSALAVASALAADGRIADALVHLRECLNAAGDDAERLALHRRLGRLQLSAGDLEGARHDLVEALLIARKRKRSTAGGGQLEIMLAALAFFEGDEAEVQLRLDEAAATFRARGVGDTDHTVLTEFVREVGVDSTSERRFERRSVEESLAAARRWANHVDRSELAHEFNASAGRSLAFEQESKR
jgi:Tfp pilus assembly protein PilF